MIRLNYFRVAASCCMLFALAILEGCATSSTRIETTHDPAANFSEFRTFGFADPLGTDRRDARTSLSMQLITATTRELQTRGMQQVSSNPDLRINFYVTEQTGVQTSNMSRSSSPFVHAHGGLTTWSGYDLRSSTAHQIVEGTLVIDIIDARRGALVFEGVAEARITESMRENLEESAGGAVAEVLARMP